MNLDLALNTEHFNYSNYRLLSIFFGIMWRLFSKYILHTLIAQPPSASKTSSDSCPSFSPSLSTPGPITVGASHAFGVSGHRLQQSPSGSIASESRHLKIGQSTWSHCGRGRPLESNCWDNANYKQIYFIFS